LEINKLLDVVIEQNASDLHLSVGRPPSIRVTGSLRSLGRTPLTPEQTMAFMKSITSDRHQRELQEGGGADFGLAYGEKARFRVSIFRERNNIGMALRLIPSKLLTFEEIGLPSLIKDVCLKPRGLVLVTGPTGSGKTTTLATMIDYINAETSDHIITVEDPIEYYHQHKKCLVTQREVGTDVPGFAEAVRRGLRQDPDVILVGEMRDLETIAAAITAAETGHLVFATLHTTGAANTVDRIIDVFPMDQQAQIRMQLSVCLEAVLSQALIPLVDVSGRIAAFEIMLCTDAIRNLIRENKTYQIPSHIQTGGKLGMILLDDFMYNLWINGKITFEEMIKHAQDPKSINEKVRTHMEQQKRLKVR